MDTSSDSTILTELQDQTPPLVPLLLATILSYIFIR